MDDNFRLRLSTAGPNRISAQSSETGHLPLHTHSLLPCVHRFDRVLDGRERPLRSGNFVDLLRGELNGEQLDRLKKVLSDLGVQLPIHTTPVRGSTPSYSQDSDTARAGSALLALREVCSQAAEVESAEGADAQRDFLGLSPMDYDMFMQRAREVCVANNATEAAQRLAEKQSLVESCQRIKQQLQNCDDMYQQSLISDTCFQTVLQGLTSELQVKEAKLASIQQAINISEDPLALYKETLMLVLKSVAENCSRKRPRVD